MTKDKQKASSNENDSMKEGNLTQKSRKLGGNLAGTLSLKCKAIGFSMIRIAKIFRALNKENTEQ